MLKRTGVCASVDGNVNENGDENDENDEDNDDDGAARRVIPATPLRCYARRIVTQENARWIP
ncbi:hypothetical protein UC34_12685 [Pandoraea vervacti]|uniref:Uncharacterized protein n=1 Tax=Pandoraea vervacti TaxID=656178 RepID=A0ABM5SY96_9BURK|nr:hypothetical protein [Pandoraea vervacti]AJP57623.1 hypothetical protein UC34_12685 [Pandoraea vervacti]